LRLSHRRVGTAPVFFHHSIDPRTMRGVTLAQLRAFTVVAKHLAFAKAADELCVTPPAVSMQIKELEQALGLSLFNREGSKVRVTLAGEYLLFYARRVFATLGDAANTMAGIKGAFHGQLTIGVVRTGSYFLPRLLAQFLAEHPCIEPRLVIANRKDLLDMLLRHSIDLAVMARPPEEAALHAEPFAPLRNVLVASPEHALARHRRLPATTLRNCRFVVREEGSETRRAMDRFLRANDLQLSYAMQIGSNEAIKQAVAANLGIGYLPMHAVKQECTAGLLRRLDVDVVDFTDHWHVAHRSNPRLSTMAEAFRYHLMEHGESFVHGDLNDFFPTSSVCHQRCFGALSLSAT
jgi:LysR family transcriptional regulator, low CO2-responsive transcriptional regulator